MRSEIHVYIGESSNIEVIREVLKSGEILVVNNNSTYKVNQYLFTAEKKTGMRKS